MNVRFLESPGIYHLHVTVPEPGLVQLYPPFPDVELTTGFELLTEKGKMYGNYKDYTTIYRQLDNGSIILSGDGRVWTPPPEPLPPEPVPDPKPPTLEEVKAEKHQEISMACEQIICSGVTVQLENSTEHFSLTEKDQINLIGKQAQLAAGAGQLEYHQDGHPCRYYPADDMQTIITAAMGHVSYHTTYCNSINMWIAGAETVEEVRAIYYGADIPEEYQSEVLKDYLAEIMAQAEKEVGESETVV